MDPNNNACVCELPPKGGLEYQQFNLLLIWILLPTVAIIGIISNIFSVVVYTRPSLINKSSSRYLLGLACSDSCICLLGILVISADSIRTNSPILHDLYVIILPYTMPFMWTIQMVTVYLTVAAAVDCWFSIWCSTQTRAKFCCGKTANKIIILTCICAFLYNAVSFFELRTVNCVDESSGKGKREVCPTNLLSNEYYFMLYKVYMYSLFMAFIPFALLLVLNALITYKVMSAKPTSGRAAKNQDSTLMLIMVVMLFLVCNSVSLAVGILELFLPREVLENFKHYLIDSGNLLVVFNSSANFFIYLIFSPSFRIIFIKQFCGVTSFQMENGHIKSDRSFTASDLSNNNLTQIKSRMGYADKKQFYQSVKYKNCIDRSLVTKTLRANSEPNLQTRSTGNLVIGTIQNI